MSKYGVFSGTYFPVFELNTEIYGVNLRIQFECRKRQTRKNSAFGHFLRSGNLVYAGAGKKMLLKAILLREKCPNTCMFLYSDWIQENTDQKSLRIWTLFT